MKILENYPNLVRALIGIYAFGALVVIGIAGYYLGVWLKNL